MNAEKNILSNESDLPTEKYDLIVTSVSPVEHSLKVMFSKSLRRKVISFRLIDILIS
jgi:hypothetical protein